MRIPNLNLLTINPTQPSTPVSTLSKETTAPTIATSRSSIPSTTVSISGQTLMRQRLFFSFDPNYRLPMETRFTPETSLQSTVNFLTENDRQVLCKTYEFAQREGADLAFVDSVGFTLADYRQHEDGKVMAPHNREKALDGEGHIVSYRFTDKDEAIAQRILSSGAMKTTEFDHGFIRFQLDKDYGPLSSFMDFGFLEQVINKFSVDGASTASLEGMFETHVPDVKNYVTLLSEGKYEFMGGGKLRIKGTGPQKESTTNQDGAIKQKALATPETLKDILRRIIFNAMGSSSRNGLPSLVDFLMKNRS